jgi:hypothetical protein
MNAEFLTARLAMQKNMLQSIFSRGTSLAQERDARAHRAYRLIEAKARELGMPTHSQTDLTIKDRAFILAAKPEKFLWIIRNNGTDIFPAQEIYRCRNWFWLQLKEHPEASVFLFSNMRLKEIPRSRLMRKAA